MSVKKLIILAGGFGTRLNTLITDVPKPLAPINGKPFLYYILQKWVENGIEEIIFLLHHRAEQIQIFVNYEKEFGILNNCKTSFIVEREPLGTGGAIANALNLLNLNGSFVVTNADTWLSSGYKEIIMSPINSMVVVMVNNPSRFGTVQIINNKIVKIQEKKEDIKAGWINAGIYHLSSEIFLNRKGNFSLEKEIFPFLSKNKKLIPIQIKTDFIDIGIPDDYIKFCNWIESGKSHKL
jgi:D-glycero-alpha-D-manno-heptose 1-phosphate guanylyltransferase